MTGPSHRRSARHLYFEQESLWTQEVSPFARALLTKAFAALSGGEKTLLDVGCGAGTLCRLGGELGLSVVAFDRSLAALETSSGLVRVRGDAGQLPFRDGSFDVVVAQDVLEHLPQGIYEGTWAELFRVSRHSVLVIAPYNEDLGYSLHRCRACGAEFHENGHERTITLEELCRRGRSASGDVERIFFGQENWPYYDEVSARIRKELAGWRPTWEMAVCPACGQGEQGPYRGGIESLLESIDLGLSREFQQHAGRWRRNRAKEIGVLFAKNPKRKAARTRGQRECDPRSLIGAKRRLYLAGTTSNEGRGAHVPVTRVAWPRGLISCASDSHALARPVLYSAHSYLYREGQQWGKPEKIAGRWARRFSPALPGGHACFVLSGNDLFSEGLGIEYFDEAVGPFAVEVYDVGIRQYIPVGTVNCVGDGAWKRAVFPVPPVLPNEWGYLCHLVGHAAQGSFPLSLLGAGRPALLSDDALRRQTDGRWRLDGGIDYPEGLFSGSGLVAVISEEADWWLDEVSLEARAKPALLLAGAVTWQAGTPLLLAMDLFDMFPVASEAADANLTERMALIAMQGMWLQHDARRRADMSRLGTATAEAQSRLRSTEETVAAADAKLERLETGLQEVREAQKQESDREAERVEASDAKLERLDGAVRRLTLMQDLTSAVAQLSRRRIFHGPCNLGGGPFRLARAQRQLGVSATSVCYPTAVYRFPCDEIFPADDELTRLPQKRLDGFAQRYDLFQFYFGISLNGLFLDDIEWLHAQGKKLVFYFCGCDIKDPRIMRERHDIHACRYCWPQRCNPNRRKALGLASEMADLIYISTPDLHEFIPGARLLQQPIDVHELRRRAPVGRPPKRGGAFVVAHSPTSRELKGTRFIVEAVDQLRQAGLDIELRVIEGMSYDEALKAYAEADLAVDQLLFGAYGQVSIEMMALGVPVVCYLREDVLPLYPEPPPIINANPDDLADVLAHYYHHREQLESFRERGFDYAERRHDSLSLAHQTILDYARLFADSEAGQ